MQGNDCDGKNGNFSIEFAPGDGHRKIQSFTFDNGGTLALGTGANAYPGRLSAKAPDQSYTYTTIRHAPVAKVTAGRAIGRWDNLCMGICNQSTADTKSKEARKETILTEESKQAVSIALTAGVEVSAGIAKASVSTTVTGSTEQAMGKSMSQSFANGETFTNTSNAVFTPEQQREFLIRAVWQWVAQTRLSTGETVTVRSNKFACTSTGTAPNYHPESDAALASCSGGLIAAVRPAAPAAQPAPVRPAPVAQPAATIVPSRSEIVASQGSSVDVTQFTLINDLAMPVNVRWIDGGGKVSPENATGNPWIAPGQSWIVANGAKTWQSHWFGVVSKSRFLCSISLRQGITANLSQLSACAR